MHLMHKAMLDITKKLNEGRIVETEFSVDEKEDVMGFLVIKFPCYNIVKCKVMSCIKHGSVGSTPNVGGMVTAIEKWNSGHGECLTLKAVTQGRNMSGLNLKKLEELKRQKKGAGNEIMNEALDGLDAA